MNWDHLRYFLALARHRTLVKAGQELQVSHTTVYRRIKALEEELGILLFQNTPQGYGLTAAGERLFRRVEPVESNINDISRELAGLDQRIHGSVTISTVDTIGAYLFPPILKKIQQRYPGITIQLDISTRRSSLSKREADIAVRVTSSPQPTLIGREVGEVDFAVYASENNQKLCAISDFVQEKDNHPLILLDDVQIDFPSNRWLENLLQDHPHLYRSNSMMAVFEMCRAGLGLAMLPDFLARRFSGLKQVYVLPEHRQMKVWVLTHRDLIRSERIRVMTRFLFDELRTCFNE